jgi:hypothetical protein
MTVKILKMITGEELIGELELVKKSDHHNDYKLKNVGMVQMVPTQTGVGLSLYPFAPYTEEDTYYFKHEHVMTTMTPGTELLNNYNRVFGSGIQLVEKSNIIA